MTLGEVDTSLIRLERLGERRGIPRVYAKDESQNATGPLKIVFARMSKYLHGFPLIVGVAFRRGITMFSAKPDKSWASRPLFPRLLILVFATLVVSLGDGVQAGTVRFAVIGDYGLAGQRAGEVAALVKSWQPDFVITTGDNNYYYGDASTIDVNIGQYYHEFIHPYVGQYGPGATTNRFFPSLGNHDWESESGVQPYLDYFTLPGDERYYDFVWGPVNLFALDSDPREPDGTTPDSVQGRWLENRLAASTARWKVVYMHHPPYSSAHHGSSTRMQWPYETWGADAVLAAHDHTYERITAGGFPYFVNGLGGASRYQFGPAIPGSQVRYNADWGAMVVDASDDSISFRFFSRTGALIDTYTLYASPEAHPPGTPSALVATTASESEIALAWVDHASNESGFVIEQATDGVTFVAIDTVGADITTYAVTGLAASATYTYRVSAWNAAGSSDASPVANATTLGVAPPAAPSALTASSVSSSRIDLAWTDHANNEQGFRIEQSTDGTTFVPIVSVAANVTKYAVTGPVPSLTYRFRLYAYNRYGNSAYSNLVTAKAAAPDLVIERLAGSPTTVGVDGSVKVTYTVANRGTAPLTQTYTEKIYLSTDAKLDAADVLLGTSQAHTADLAAGATRSYSQSVRVPPGTAAGSYFLLLQGDAAGVIGETDEQNNVASLAVTVSLPDLVIEGLKLSSSSVRAGVSVTVAYKVVNRGAVTVTPTYTDKIYLSTDAKLDAGDVLLGTSHGHGADLAPGATHAHSQAVRVPAGTAARNYFLLVEADALGALNETDEDNNVSAVSLTVIP